MPAHFEPVAEQRAAIPAEPAECLCDRRGDFAFGQIFPARFQFTLEASQIEHIVDDLKGEPIGFEEIRQNLFLG